MWFINLIKKNSLLFGIISLIGLTLTSRVLTLFQINTLWFSIVYYYLILVLLFLILINQNENLESLNIDSFTLVLLVLLRAGTPFEGISSDFQELLRFADLFLVIGLLIAFVGKEKKKIAKLSLTQVVIFFIGVFFGLGIAIIKILLNKSDLWNLAVTYPLQFGYSFLLSFTLYMLSTEFIFRGFLWGFLKMKGVSTIWIIFITTLMTLLVILPIHSDIGGLINSILLYLFMGFLVWRVKSINISIGFVAGYASFLILQSVLGK